MQYIFLFNSVHKMYSSVYVVMVTALSIFTGDSMGS